MWTDLYIAELQPKIQTMSEVNQFYWFNICCIGKYVLTNSQNLEMSRKLICG